MSSHLRDQLRLLRRARGQTQADLAREVGLTQGALSQYENGSSDTTTARLELLADALNARVLIAPKDGTTVDVHGLSDAQRELVALLIATAPTMTAKQLRAVQNLLEALGE